MSEAEFTAIVARAKTQGIDLEGRAGTIEHMGVKAKWVFDGAVLTLSKEAVEEKLRAALG
jgi:hypothetical protein